MKLSELKNIIREIITEDWWSSLSKDEQDAYIKSHPKSSKAVNAKNKSLSWSDINKKDKQAKFDKKVKSGDVSLIDKLGAHSSGIKVKETEKLKPHEVESLIKLYNMMSDDTKKEFNKMNASQAVDFLNRIKARVGR